jgi:(p)ppGpp synthase/HD superfamily hydrolase
MTPEFARAIELASAAHMHQTDKAGRPYVEHLERVSKAVAQKVRAAPDLFTLQEISAICTAAVLHDIVEDTLVKAPSVRALYGARIADMVDLVTKKPGHVYAEGINRIVNSGNLGAILIKLADLEDNMDAARRELLAIDQRPVPAKYLAAHERLTRAAEALGYRPPPAPAMASTLADAPGP